jgi:hypothetical protein
MQYVAGKTNPETASFNIRHDRGPERKDAGNLKAKPSGLGWDSGVLKVAGACVFFYKAGQSTPSSIASCLSQNLWVVEDGSALLWDQAYRLQPDQKNLTVHGLLKGIESACSAQVATREAEEAPKRQAAEAARVKAVAEAGAPREREAEAEAAAERAEAEWEQTYAAKRASDFRDGILAVLRAAEEPDPFASIRGDFDLSASDSHQWKTNFSLPKAEKCALIRTPPVPPTSLSAWTFGCMFRLSDVASAVGLPLYDGRRRWFSSPDAKGRGYEQMVNTVQSVLKLPYQPDETAVNVNQVFFADPAKPTWRLFVAKINEATVGISIVAVQSAVGVPTFTNMAPFPTVPTVLPAHPTISEEIEKVRNGRYTPLPPIQSTGAPSTNGMGVFEVKNNTPYTLTALFSGPIERRVEVPARGSISIDLPAGSYKLVGRVDAPNVLPSYGEHVFDASSAGLEFYIQ